MLLNRPAPLGVRGPRLSLCMVAFAVAKGARGNLAREEQRAARSQATQLHAPLSGLLFYYKKKLLLAGERVNVWP